MTFDIPQKLYFKIGEVSRLADVAPHVIRYWESEFEQITPKRASSNQRLYRRDDVILILKIKQLLHGNGYTIAGARRFLESGSEIPEDTDAVDPLDVRQKLKQIKSELLQLQRQLEQKR